MSKGRRGFLRKVKDLLCCFSHKVPVYIAVRDDDMLKGRRVLLTGGTGGIGRALACAFVRAGAVVTITGRSEERLRETAEFLAAEQISVETQILDVRREESFPILCERLAADGRFPDILVNNAGLVGGGRFGKCSSEAYDAVLETNLRGSFFLSQEIARRWKKTKTQGNILNVCSASSLRPGNSPYILSKWGLRALTAGLAKELIPYGIVVNGIAPGPTATDRFCPEGESRGVEFSANPAGRLVTPNEIAGLAVVLVSNMSRMVVGDILYVTGGAGVVTYDDV